MGWSPDFQRQLDPSEIGATTPCRISAVHRNRVDAIGENGPMSLVPPPGLSTAEIAVGDWALSSGQRCGGQAIAEDASLTLATVVNCIGIGFQRGTHTRRQLVVNDGTGAPTLTDMGASFAVATGVC